VLQDGLVRELSMRQALGGRAACLIGYHAVVLGDGFAFLLMEEGACTLTALCEDR
jgi:hypothetical protein